MNGAVESVLKLEKVEHLMNLFGSMDSNIKIMEDTLKVKISYINDEIKITGAEEDILKARIVLQSLAKIAGNGEPVTRQSVNYAVSLASESKLDSNAELPDDYICLTAKGMKIKPKTFGQKLYTDALMANDIVFSIGPAGTGKTYLAVAMAVNSFRNRQVSRIILTRPAIEAGERLGFLPGDLQDKVDPYLRPLYDALYEIMGVETYSKYLEKGMIEVAPLAYMRGRTLDNSFVILDEAQNTTHEQMKMLLTRIGFGSKAVITGDVTQTDLPGEKKSGLKEAVKILSGIEGIAIVQLSDKDVIRHELVQKIIRAYEEHEADQLASNVVSKAKAEQPASIGRPKMKTGM